MISKKYFGDSNVYNAKTNIWSVNFFHILKKYYISYIKKDCTSSSEIRYWFEHFALKLYNKKRPCPYVSKQVTSLIFVWHLKSMCYAVLFLLPILIPKDASFLIWKTILALPLVKQGEFNVTFNKTSHQIFCFGIVANLSFWCWQ